MGSRQPLFQSIRSKILVLVISVMVVSTALIVFFSYTSVVDEMRDMQDESTENLMRMVLLHLDAEYQDMVDFEEREMRFRRRMVRQAAQVVFSGIDNYYDAWQEGVYTEVGAQQEAFDFIKNVRYGNDDYFFVYDETMTSLAHPDPKVEGRNLYNATDIKGDKYSPTLIRLALQEGEGFHQIWWTRLGSDEHVPKLLYVRHYPKWEWIVGTGIYIDDIASELERERENVIRRLRATVPKVQFATSGNLFVFDSGLSVIVPPRNTPGGFASMVNLDTGRTVFKDFKDAADIKEGFFAYTVRGPDQEPVEKLAKVRYFEPFDWYAAATVDRRSVAEPVRNLAVQQMLINGLVSLAAMVLIFWAVGRICAPLPRLAEVADHIAEGDLMAARQMFRECRAFRQVLRHGRDDVLAGDEAGRLTRIFHRMSENLNSLVGHVQASGSMVKDASEKISGITQEVETAVEEQVASTRQVSKSAREISDRSGELAKTVNSVSRSAEETAGLADEAHAGLAGMGESMTRLSEAGEAISSRLGVINEKASNINKIVTTISKVSEKTNLLSLNAAIEAEKAGEYGQGFSVVAREMRKLADQTAVATLDIEKMVDEMRSAVSSGVMEMDKFDNEVEKSVHRVGRIGGDIGEVIERVRALGPRFASADQDMQAQNTAASSISEAMRELQSIVEHTRDSLQGFLDAGDKLADTIRALEKGVSHFHVEKDEV